MKYSYDFTGKLMKKRNYKQNNVKKPLLLMCSRLSELSKDFG